MSLNPSQQEAVDTLSGPLLVLAGAGSGKTRVVTFRIANLIQHGIRPERILAVTFTNKAAAEMRERVCQVLGIKPRHRTPKPEVSTFHSLCVKILHRNIQNLGYPQDFAIYDRGDQESMARAVLKDIRCSEAVLKPSDLVNHIGNWKTQSVRPADAAHLAETDKEHLAAVAYRYYQEGLKAVGAVDFDDLLLLTEELFRTFPQVADAEAARFDHILVDEYQDTNQSQYRIVKTLAERHRNLCVVGDDDQSIYAWRGAEVAHILRFKNDWPDAKVVYLMTNYRSTTEILAWSNRLIAFNAVRHAKTLEATCQGESPRILQLADEEKEAEFVVNEIKSRIAQGHRPHDFAVLFRTNEQPRAFETEFRRKQVPYVLVGGQSFFDRKEVRDVLAYLKMITAPKDEISLLRVINTPARGIGQQTITQITETAVKSKIPLWDCLSNAQNLFSIKPNTLKAIQGFQSMVTELRDESRRMSLVDFIPHLLDRVRYRDEIVRLYEKAGDQETRWNSVQELANAAGAYLKRSQENQVAPSLRTFVQELTLSDWSTAGDSKEEKLAGNNVTLMTLHAAKGLEFQEVYMVGLEEGYLPHRRSIESYNEEDIAEERRLCYVGFTRAQKRLTLTFALTRMKWGKPRDTIPSRFLYEATGQSENPNYYLAKKGRLPGKKS